MSRNHTGNGSVSRLKLWCCGMIILNPIFVSAAFSAPTPGQRDGYLRKSYRGPYGNLVETS